MSKPTPLSKKINQIVNLRTTERDLYPYLRDLLTDDQYGIKLAVDQVVVDTPLPGVRDAPDLAIYLADASGVVLRGPDHAVGVVEVEAGKSVLAGAPR